MDGGRKGGLNEVLWVVGGWVGGWVIYLELRVRVEEEAVKLCTKSRSCRFDDLVGGWVGELLVDCLNRRLGGWEEETSGHKWVEWVGGWVGGLPQRKTGRVEWVGGWVGGWVDLSLTSKEDWTSWMAWAPKTPPAWV